MPSTRLGSVRMVFVLAVSLFGAEQTLAQFTSPVSDISIETEFEYQQFRGAIERALYLQVDFLLDEQPRAAVAIAGLMVFATNNPLATQADFDQFLLAYDSELTAYQFRGGVDTDPDLQFGTNLIGAVRRHSRIDDPALAGFDTRIGDEVLTRLGLEIPEPFDYNGLEERTRAFESARLTQIGGAPELTELLVVGLYSSDLDGTAREGLGAVIEDYLISKGFDTSPNPTDPRYLGTTNAIEQLPGTYAEYQSLLAQFGSPIGFDPLNPPNGGDAPEIAEVDAASTMVINSDLYTQILECLDNIAGDNESGGTPSALELVLQQIQADLDDPERPTMLEALELAEDPASLEARRDELRTSRLAIAEDRATADWASLLMLQSEQQVANTFGSSVREFSKLPTRYYDDAAKVEAINDYIIALGSALVAGASKDAGGVLDATIDGVFIGVRIGEVFSGRPIPLTPEEMLYNQGVETRNQIADLTQLMEDRFRNIDQQLLVISDNLNIEFAVIGDSLDELTANVDGVVESLSVQGAQLDRIEDALWGVGTDLLTADFATVSNDTLNRSNLPYDQGAPNFSSDLSEFFTRATVVSLGETYAGPAIPTLTFDSATAQLFSRTFDANDQSLIRIDPIGRLLNDLRQFPTILDNDPDVGPLTDLGPVQVVGGAPWAQAAVAHTQLARNNPWFFKARLDGIGLINGYTGLDDIIAEGEVFDAMTKAARDQGLFDELFAGYDRSAQNIVDAQEEALTRMGNLGRCEPYGAPSITLTVDLLSGLVQPQLAQQLTDTAGPLRDTAEGGTVLDDAGSATEGELLMPNDVTGWELFGIPTGTPGEEFNPLQVAAALAYGDVQCGAFPNYALSIDYNFTPIGSSDTYLLNLQAIVTMLRADGVLDSVGTTRRIGCTIRVNGTPLMQASEVQLENLFADDLPFWTAFRSGVGDPQVQDVFLLNGESLAGQVLTLNNSINDQIEFTFIFDDRLAFGTGPGLEGAEAFLQGRLSQLREQAWGLLDGTIPGALATEMSDSQDDLMNWVSLIDGYSTLALPRLLESSDVVRSGLRSAPIINNLNYASPDTLNLRVDAVDFFTRNRLNPLAGDRIDGRFGERAARVQDEVNFALQTPGAEGHGYVEYVLAELLDLRDNAGRLAIDDCYQSDGTTLVVDAANGLLANDVTQSGRTTTIDLASVTPSTGGSVSVMADGSFIYTPDPGTTEFSFTYRTATDVYLMGESMDPGTTYSDVATVKIKSPPEPITISVPSDQPTIQAAIDAIESGPSNTILVEPGTYTESLDSLGKSFVLRSTDGPATTIISNDGTGRTFFIDGDENYIRVTIEGITFIDAPPGTFSTPGAIFHQSNGILRVSGCVIRDNDRAALYSRSGSIVVEGCRFENNTSETGSGVNFDNLTDNRSVAIISDCEFMNNHAVNGRNGGAARFRDTIAIVDRCLFHDNSAEFVGGAILHTRGHLYLDRCEFVNNTADSGTGAGALGGALYIEQGPATISNSLLAGNHAETSGGAITTRANGVFELANCTLAFNTATVRGGTFDGSSSSMGPHAVSNSIVWNAGTTSLQIWGGGFFDITYSLIDGGYAGTGNIQTDPMFAGPDDYRLSPMSPAIDAGNNALDLGRPLDLSGEARRIDDPDVFDTGQGMAPIVDMGAYEYTEAVPVNICASDFDNDGDVDLTDFGTFGAAFGSMTGDLNYNPDADFDIDGDVDLTDFGTFGSEFGFADCLEG